MYRFIVAVCFILLLFGCNEEGVSIKEGDLLFQANEPSQLTKAIEGAGVGYNGLTFSHVGIICIDNSDTNVIEAVPEKGVVITPLQKYLSQSAKKQDGTPFVYVARLLPEYENLIDDAITRAKSLEGKPYDSVFLPDNDAYYCSELVYSVFLDRNGNPIFESAPMSFKNKITNEFYPAWVEFFSHLNMPIPEGVIGTNPNDMSRSGIIELNPLFTDTK
ncbi:MAG: hypothetical protein LBR17_01590 [Bacteroidales bacterium]|jgi:uncharacterized protein YycO|nr:hypothetical protein [Bacteroidales bacterium]